MGEIGAARALSTGERQSLPPALPSLGAIRLSPAWKFVLNVYKGSKKVYKKR